MSDAPKPSRGRPLVSQFAGEPEMAELVELFVTELPGRVAALSAAWSEGRVNDVTRMAHQLKGASGGYGFPTIGEAAGKLEAQLRSMARPDSGSLERIRGEFAALVELCSRASVAGR